MLASPWTMMATSVLKGVRYGRAWLARLGQAERTRGLHRVERQQKAEKQCG